MESWFTGFAGGSEFYRSGLRDIGHKVYFEASLQKRVNKLREQLLDDF